MPNIFMRWFVLLCCVGLLWACAKDSIDPQMRALLNKPDWVSGDSSQYPQHLFLAGHGVSAELDIAKRQSLDDVTQRFRSQLKELLANHSATQSGVSHSNHTVVDERILSNRQIAEIWQDPVSKAYHVLAVIDRVQASNDIQGAVNRIDARINRVLKKAGQQPDALQRVAYAHIALGKIGQYEHLLTSLKVLKNDAVSSTLQWTPDDIRNQVHQWLADVTLLPVLENNDPELKQAFRGGVESAGFIVDYGARPDYVLKALFQKKHVRWNDGVYTLDGNLRLELWDGDWKGQVRGAMNWPIKISATERDLLDRELASAIKKVNKQKLKATLIELQADE